MRGILRGLNWPSVHSARVLVICRRSRKPAVLIYSHLSLFASRRASDVEAPLDTKHVILRGCKLRNTKLVHGLIVFAGFDTKLMQNSGAVRFKRTHIDMKLNRLVLAIFVILLILASICAIFLGLYEHSTAGDEFWRTYLPRVDSEKPSVMAFYNFWSAIIILNTVVPISLYVTIEAIRLGQSIFIMQDREMYHPESNTPTVARSTNLSEELGQIDYVFSDKTGTLTQNVMKFKKASIGGIIYGKDNPEVTVNLIVANRPPSHGIPNPDCSPV